MAGFPGAGRPAFGKPGGRHPGRGKFAAMPACLPARAPPGVGAAAYRAGGLTGNTGDTAGPIRVRAAGGHPVSACDGGNCGLSTASGRKRLRDDACAAGFGAGHGRERVPGARAEAAAAGGKAPVRPGARPGHA